MADFGLYQALRGQSDWNAKRHDSMMNMQIASMREQRSKQALQEQMQMDAGMQAAFDAMANMDVLTEDQERIKGVEKNARKTILEGIARNHGDLKRYMATGGYKDLGNYKASILQSEEVKNAIANKINLQNYVNDRSKNAYIKSVLVDMPVVGADGKEVMQPTRMTMEQQLKLFQQGKIKKLNYAGAESKVNLGIEDFSGLYKNPLDPYHPDNYVSESDIYKKALSKGASEEHAKDLASRYGGMVKQGGTAWRWNAGDIAQLKLQYDKLNLQRQKMAMSAKSGGGGSGSPLILNTLGTRAETLRPGQVMPLSSTEKELWPKTLDFQPIKEDQAKFGGKYKFSGTALTPDLKTEIPMGSLEILQIGDGSGQDVVKGADGKMYLIATVSGDDDDPAITNKNNLIGDEPIEGQERNFVRTENTVGNFWNFFGLDHNYTGQVYIPIENYIRDAQTREIENKNINTKTNHTNNPADFNDEAERMKAYQMMQMFEGVEQNYGYPIEELTGEDE